MYCVETFSRRVNGGGGGGVYALTCENHLSDPGVAITVALFYLLGVVGDHEEVNRHQHLGFNRN